LMQRLELFFHIEKIVDGLKEACRAEGFSMYSLFSL
jgi:hypothetical protein